MGNVSVKQISEYEKERIADIRRALKRFKRRGVEVETWEATFFLRIIDRLTRAV